MKISVRVQLTLAIILIVAVVITAFLFTFGRFFDIATELSVENTAASVASVSNSINSLITNIDYTVLPLAYNSEVKEFFLGDTSVTEQVNANIQQLLSHFAGQGIELILINTSTKIIAATRPEMINTYRILGTQWINKIIEANGERILISGYRTGNDENGTLREVICTARAIFSDSGKLLGYMMAEIPVSLLSDICRSAPIGNDGFIAVLDADNIAIFHTNTEQIGKQQLLAPNADEANRKYYYRTINNVPMLVTDSRSAHPGFLVMGFIPVSNIQNTLSSIRTNFIGIIMLVGFLAFLYALVLSSTITKPLFNLRDYMHQLENGNFSVRIHTKRKNEIGYLENGFDRMAERLENLVDIAHKAEIQEKDAEFRALVSTVNPHFIYNALESISMTAYMNDDNEVVTMTNVLADILRASLDVHESTITVQQEIENIRNYVFFQKIKSPDLFTVVYNIEEWLYPYKIPKHLLQPLVENSIQHGFREMDSGGVIEINIYNIGNEIHCSVKDNGTGFSDETLNYLNDVFSEKTPPAKYLALFNIFKRVQLTYGTEYGVTIKNNSIHGSEIEIVLPLCNFSADGEKTENEHFDS
ncbi:MAG: histidine kinase [Anaerolineaceae bacterium]|nr:histidine kinase [Anaerolineaceae bacterium]